MEEILDYNGSVIMNKEEGTDKEDRTTMNILISIFYSLIVVVSVCGNSLVCKTIIFKPGMRNSTNILILVLSISDLLMTIFNIPFTVIDIILNDWIFGEFMCIMVAFTMANCVYVSSFTMVLIAVHRYRCVYYTKVSARTGSTAFKKWFALACSIFLVLILAAFAALPHTIFNRIILADIPYYGNVRLCRPQIPESQYDLSLWLTLETLATQYMLPMSLVILLYSRICVTIYRQGRVGVVTEERNRQLTEKKRRRIMMLILVVVIFALCWLPFNVYYLLVDFEIIKLNFRVFLFVHWFAMSSVCYNPFVYCWLNESFRKEAKAIIAKLKCSSDEMLSFADIQRSTDVEGKMMNLRNNHTFEITNETNA